MKKLIYRDWANFGWYGISLEIPADWNPGKLGGDARSGSSRLDDSEIVRLEIEWKEAGGDDRVGLIVDRYVEGLAKNAQKQNTRLRVDRTADCPGLELGHMRSAEYFVWESGFRVHTLACYSAPSDRLLFLRAMGRPSEDLAGVLPRLFNSLRDVPATDPQPWALYDLAFASPPGYELDHYELKSGHIRLRFRRGSNLLQIDRLSLAKTLLNQRTLQDWYREFFRKDLRHLDYQAEDAEIDGHEGLVVSGRPKSRWRGLLLPLPFWNPRPRLHVACRAWLCPESNKIFVAHTHWKRGQEAPDCGEIQRTVICHAGPAQGAHGGRTG